MGTEMRRYVLVLYSWKRGAQRLCIRMHTRRSISCSVIVLVGRWKSDAFLFAPCRPPTEFIPPVQEPYQYIIFRASEVKDLSVDEPAPLRSVHDDPAVLGVCIPLHHILFPPTPFSSLTRRTQ